MKVFNSQNGFIAWRVLNCGKCARPLCYISATMANHSNDLSERDIKLIGGTVAGESVTMPIRCAKLEIKEVKHRKQRAEDTLF